MFPRVRFVGFCDIVIPHNASLHTGFVKNTQITQVGALCKPACASSRKV
jgi:hypothetical protein